MFAGKAISFAFDFGFQETDAFARDDTVFFVHLLEIWMPLSHCCD